MARALGRREPVSPKELNDFQEDLFALLMRIAAAVGRHHGEARQARLSV